MTHGCKSQEVATFLPNRIIMRVLVIFTAAVLAMGQSDRTSAYLGFDRNAYPGDANLKALHETFSYTGYWLNHPPGEKTNSWTGHRAAVASAGFGFLVLFNGRLYADLKSAEPKTVAKATRLGQSDAQAAAAAARREGFPAQTIIFLDEEQGGRMLPEQKAYIYAWGDGVTAAGFRAGIYCSGVPAVDDDNVVTAEDIRANAAGRNIVYWATNDACPPAPGCAFPKNPPSPAESGVPFAEVWQYAQSPRTNTAAHCTNYNPDGDCMAPKIPAAERLHIDINSATSPDPSRGR